MAMDLESLLADLDMAANKTAPKSAPAPPAAAPVAAAAVASQQQQQSGSVSFDDLDSLMDDLTLAAGGAPPPPKQPTTTPAGAARTAVAVEASASPVPQSKPVVVATAVSSPMPASKPVERSTPPPPATAQASVIDDLDALVESLDATAKEAAAAQAAQQQSKAKPAPATVQPTPPAPQQQQQPHPPPTAAPIDALDDLLGELNMAMPPPPAASTQQQKPPTTTTTTAVVPPPAAQQSPARGRQPRDELDGLLANLSSEMSRVDTAGDTAVSRGTCGRCGRPITGEVIQAMGKMWHPEHFTCASCKQPLGTSTFYESDGQPHCDRCWKSLFCPRCSHCDQPIADRCITALGKKWHPEHFICSQCLQPLDQGFFERDGKAFCEKCFYGAFSAKCAGCGQPIQGECINALGQKWHPEHFVCQTCKKSFGSGAFFEYQGAPYCEVHYYQMTGSLCAGCGKPVGTRSISALGKKWHPEHFICAWCLTPLGGSSFKEQAGKAYCSACHAKLFA